MQSVLVTLVSLAVSGALAGVTVIGLVDSQSASPDRSSTDLSSTVNYGTTE